MKKLIYIVVFILFTTTVDAAEIYRWKLDETSPTSVNDVIEEITDAHADPINGISTVARTGSLLTTRAYDFNGTDDYVDCNDTQIEGESVPTTLSISAWFYADGWSSGDVIFCNNGKTFSNANTISLFYDASGLVATTGDSGANYNQCTGTVTINNDTWYHVVLAVETGATKTIEIFVNGVSVGDTTPATDRWPATFTDFTIARGVGNFYFDGKIDDVRIYNTTFDTTAALALYDSYTEQTFSVEATMDGLIEDRLKEASMDAVVVDINDGLQYQWKMDEANWSAGTDAVTEEIGSYHGNAVGDAATIDRSPDTKITTRWGDFDGTGDQVLFNDLDALSFPSSGSVSCWFNADTIAQYDPIWSNQGNTFLNNNALRVIFADTDGHLTFYTGDSSGNLNDITTTDFVASTATDYFMVATWEAGSIKLYINGVEVASDTPETDRIPSNWDDFSAGKAIANYYYEGQMDDLRIYNRVLPQSEIMFLYELYGYTTIQKQVSMDAIVHAFTYDFISEGDSIPWGFGCGTPSANCTTAWTIKCYLEAASGWSGINLATSGDTTSDVLDDMPTNISTDAEKIYLTVGTNDYYFNLAEATSKSNIEAIYAAAIAGTGTAPTEIIVGEIPPVTARASNPPYTTETEEIQEKTKKLNAMYRSFCTVNNVKLGPTYWAMTKNDTTAEDDISTTPDYNYDDLHIECLGQELMADNYYDYAAVPTRTWQWGVAADGVNDISLSWWLLNGSSSVSGDADTGTLVIPQNDTVDSNVVTIESGTKTLTITPTTAAGTPAIYYRVSEYNFDRDDATDRNSETVSWVAYSAPVEIEKQFLQIRIEGDSVADTQISDIEVEWTEGVEATTAKAILIW